MHAKAKVEDAYRTSTPDCSIARRGAWSPLNPSESIETCSDEQVSSVDAIVDSSQDCLYAIVPAVFEQYVLWRPSVQLG